MASVDHRSAAEIERDIEDERGALARTLDEIQDRLSFEALTGEFTDRIRENGTEIGRSVVRGVKENPVPLALTAVGLAWLIVSQRSGSRYDDPYERAAATPTSARVGVAGTRDYRDPDATADPAPLYDASGKPISDGGSRWDHATEGAQERAREMRQGASRGMQGASRGMSQASGAVRRRASGAYASAAELRQRIAHGTEEMSASARKRVIAARTRAYEAQLRAEKFTAQGREKASDFYEEQPLVAGALALAVGAAIGGLLPRTRREDHAFGEYRDRVFDEAERIYHEERSKLETVARETADEARNVAREVADEVSEDVKSGAERAGDIARNKFSEVGSTAKAGAEHVAETAKSEADSQELGKPGKVSQ